MSHQKPDPFKQMIANITPPPEHLVQPKDPDIYLSTSPWQIMSYDYELATKQRLLDEIFRAEGIDITSTLPRTDGKDYYYRNKMEYALYWDNAESQIRLAFHQRNSHRKIPITQSSIERPEILARAKELIAELNATGGQARDYTYLLLRCNQSGEVSGGLIPKHQPHPHFPPLTDTLLGHPYTYSPNGFFQINLPVYELALQEIAHHITTEKVLDLYAGVGTIGLSVARYKQLTLVETNPNAFEELERNITRTGLKTGDPDRAVLGGRREGAPISSLPRNGEGHCGQDPKHPSDEPVFTPHAILSKSETATDQIHPDTTVIVDPPRAGLHPKLIEKLNQTQPPTIIYLSCNPVTQARDLAHLSDHYQITHVQPFNFFPRTPHIENLVILQSK